MPYINKDQRLYYDTPLEELIFNLNQEGWNAGHVTYVLYKIVLHWFKDSPSYATIANIRGCLVGTMTEFDRREAAHYENNKIDQNGDV